MKLEVMTFGWSNVTQWLEVWWGTVSNVVCLDKDLESRRWQLYQLIELLMDSHLQIVELTYLVPF